MLSREDEDVSWVVGESFERRGMQIEIGIGGVNGIERVSEGSGGLLLSYDPPDGSERPGWTL